MSRGQRPWRSMPIRHRSDSSTRFGNFSVPLIRGQSTVIVPEDVGCDPSRLVDLLSSEKVTRMVVVPSFLSGILDCPKRSRGARLQSLSHWAASGETLTLALAGLFADRLPKAELFNIYGASEFWDATWFSSRDPVGGSSVPIGAPIANMRALVLNSDLDPVPVSVAGELHIGAPGSLAAILDRPRTDRRTICAGSLWRRRASLSHRRYCAA